MRRARRALPGLSGGLFALLAACSSDPTDPPEPALEVVVASGDGQYGVVGQELSSPLRAVVRSNATGSPREDVTVLWEVTSGAATLLESTTAVTDSTGSTDMAVELGSAPGEVEVRVSVQSQPAASATFSVFAVDQPDLTQVSPSSAAAGGIVTLTGSNFSPVAGQNVVLFSGVRGEVVSATSTSLQVEVPVCLPARDVQVVVQLGVVASPSRTLTVTGGGTVTSMSVGQVADATDPDGFGCFLLAGGVGTRYLVLAYSAGTVGAAQHPFVLTALSSGSAVPAPARAGPVDESPAGPASDPQAAWDEHLRRLEGELIRDMRAGAPVSPARVGPRAAPPTVGHTRTFNVLNGQGDFDQVEAEARFVGSHAAIYVDLGAPSDGFTAQDLDSIAGLFDEVIHPEVTQVFGDESDVDENDRVIILFTPEVNELTPPGSAGFVGGFFFAGDLLEENEGTNFSEVFYALVPDPAGVHGDERPTEEVMSVVPAILAHEFQHMVHFNRRVLVLDAAGQEALWLSEALAQMAEEVVARSYDAVGDDAGAQLFREGARVRARRYLQRTDTVSVIVTAGQGSLAERGAGFLHLLYLADQEGVEVLGRLTATTRTGVANVEAQAGRGWAELLPDWWSAIWLDGPGPESGPLVYPNIDLRDYLVAPFPLAPPGIGPGDATISRSLWSSSVAYYILTPPVGGPIAVRLGGDAGGPSSPQAALGLRIIRIP